jgi:hypothetical protein
MIKNVEKIHLEDWQVNAFVGDNVEYYQKKWKEHQGSYYGGWNWVPFFFSLEWLAYRKMYKEAAIAFLIPLVINLVFIFSPFHLDVNSKLFADTIKIIFAIFGNAMYRKKLLSILDKTKDMKQEQKKLLLSERGGTSLISLGICLLLEVGLLILAFM